MTAIDWSNRPSLNSGVNRGVLYISEGAMVWNGLTSVEETVIGGNQSSCYFDGVKILDLISSEDFGLNVSAYFYPEELETTTEPFGFSYRNGDVLHLAYNVTAITPTKAYPTLQEEITPTDFSWVFMTVPNDIPGLKPTAHLMVNVKDAHPGAIAALEELLYGTESSDPFLPSPDDIIEIFGDYATLTIIDHGDGTWTATGPDEMVHMLDGTTFEIVSPTVYYLNSETYTVSSY